MKKIKKNLLKSQENIIRKIKKNIKNIIRNIFKKTKLKIDKKNEYARKYYYKNREKLIERQREYNKRKKQITS